MKNGIDVSEHQGNIDWERVKASGEVDFAIIRAGYGRLATQKDKQFDRNYSECKRLGIPCGAYWYSYATTVDEAREEARVCLEIVRGKSFEYPIYFDIEEKKAFATGGANCSEMIKAFCNSIEDGGFWAGLYCSRSPLTQYISESVRKRYALWVAEYGSVCNYNGTYGMWQKSSTGSIPGISGNVDLDEGYVDYPAIIKSRGDNGFPKPTAPAFKKTMKVTVEYDDHTYSGLLEEGSF